MALLATQVKSIYIYNSDEIKGIQGILTPMDVGNLNKKLKLK